MHVKTTWTPLYLLIILLFTFGCNSNGNQSPETNGGESALKSIHHDFRIVTVAEGFQHPWSMGFLPNGDMLVTERGRSGNNGRPGRLRIVRDGELLPDPVSGLPEIRAAGQGGLLDVILHPDFESNRLLYISYSKPNEDGSEGTTAVIRGRFENNELEDVEEIFEAQVWSSGQGHYGSRLAFDDDGYLFITVGDRQENPGGGIEAQREHPSQGLTTHHGKVIRLHDDGSVPSDNPYVNREDALPEIWSYGHRNPQGLAVHPETNEVWANEHGPQGGDELNHIRPGVNYGWPVIGFGVNYGPGEPLHDVVSAEGMEHPILHWRPSIAPGGLMIYNGDKFPEWQGDIFTGGMSGQHKVLSRVTVDGSTLISQELLLPGEFRIRDIRQGPDGYIYLATDDRSGDLTPIVRLEPVQ